MEDDALFDREAAERVKDRSNVFTKPGVGEQEEQMSSETSEASRGPSKKDLMVVRNTMVYIAGNCLVLEVLSDVISVIGTI